MTIQSPQSCLLVTTSYGLQTIEPTSPIIEPPIVQLPTLPSSPSMVETLPPVADNHTRLYLCRHGQTDHNLLHKLQGRGVNAHLNQTGITQATYLAHAMRNITLSAIHSSSLNRARETAAIIAQYHVKMKLKNYEDLEEMSFGILESHTHDAFKDEVHQVHQQWNNGNYNARFPSGESPIEVSNRGATLIDTLMKKSKKNGHVLMVTHGRFNKVILSKLLYGNLDEMQGMQQDNTCVNVVDYNHETHEYIAVKLNDTSHLPVTPAL